MKVLFSKSIVMISLLSLLAGASHAQNQDNGTLSDHKFLYGIQLGLTENKFDLYSTHGGLIAIQNDPSSVDVRSYHARGFRFAVIGEARLGRFFSLRVMPGVSLFKALKLESVRGELPIDLKFHPVRKGNIEPYIASGLGYGYDFASLHNNGNSVIKPLNAHDIRCSCGLGLDWYSRIVRVGFELKAGFDLLPLGDGGSNFSYFHSSPTFCLGINIEG